MELRKINLQDAKAQWEYTTVLPEDENGLTNPYHGVSFDEYREKVLPTLISYEHPVNMPDWFVPETYYYLWDDGKLVGEFRIRHHLTDVLRTGAGHIGYSISKDHRGKGYGTEGLKLTLQIAKGIVPEEEIYLRVNKDNIASQKVMTNNGAYRTGEDEDHFFMRVKKNTIYELEDTSKVSVLFDGWQETLIYSCLQKVMGKIYVTDLDNPKSAYAHVGCFTFYAGEPDKELVLNKPKGFTIMVPQNEAWAALIEECFSSAKRVTRYAIKKDTKFNKDALKKFVEELPAGYELHEIDSDLYDKCLEAPFSEDFVSSFGSKEFYLKSGRGMVITKDGNIVAGASSYTRYNEGIEIEVDTATEERKKNLATVACAALILRCLSENLYPSWDAQNKISVHLAEKLGYEFDHEYVAYEVDSKNRTNR